MSIDIKGKCAPSSNSLGNMTYFDEFFGAKANNKTSHS
jgi:hypothetical protein